MKSNSKYAGITLVKRERIYIDITLRALFMVISHPNLSMSKEISRK